MSNTKIPSSGIDPRIANSGRRGAKKLHRISLRIRVTSSRGRIARKRKKYIHKAERHNYRVLLMAVAQDLARKAAQ